MHEQAARLSRGHDLVKAANYMLKRWPAFTLFLDDGRICLSRMVLRRGNCQDVISALSPFRRLSGSCGFVFQAATMCSCACSARAT